ncbi:nuclear transport factor 2 family protein [Bacillus timonensis]|nr:nuclear transport factor 2 family protein [Bacillus timonensis]
MEVNKQDHTVISRKEQAVTFLQLVASGEVKKAYELFIGSDFKHHNPYFPGNAATLMQAMEENAEQNPQKTLEVKQVIEEGDRVVTYSHIKQTSEDLGWAVVHIFRFEAGRLVELWDIGQAVPENSVNTNGMF